MLQQAANEIIICSPFVALEGTRFVVENARPDFNENGRLSFLTNLSVSHVCQLATDPRALQSLQSRFPSALIYHVPGLHAKVYIVDESRAIVTSGNLTANGLYRNLEYGVAVDDQNLVKHIRAEILEFSQFGALIPGQQLDAYCNVLTTYLPQLRLKNKRMTPSFEPNVESALQQIDDGLMRLRLASGPIHTAFGRTIEYLLRKHGPMSTVDMHPMISAIHPDLCDDSVDRIIDGKRFGKKWKHAVRTAQQQLKKQNRIHYVDGVWTLKQRA
jgi:hypothetical protein